SPVNAAIDSKLFVVFCQSRKSGYEVFVADATPPFCWLRPSPMVTSRDGSLYGSGLSNAEYTTEKIAAFAPIPSASVSTATAVNTGAFASVRAAYFTFCPSELSIPAIVSPPAQTPVRPAHSHLRCHLPPTQPSHLPSLTRDQETLPVRAWDSPNAEHSPCPLFSLCALCGLFGL